jgi:hypothetical protein
MRNFAHLSSTKRIAIHLTNPTLAICIACDFGFPVFRVSSNLFCLKEPKGCKCTKVINMDNYNPTYFVTCLRVLRVELGKYVVTAYQIAADPSSSPHPSEESHGER